MKKTEFPLVLTHAVFKLLPTLLIGIYLWLIYSATLTELHTSVGANIAVFSLGLIGAFFLYSYQVRFSSTFLLLLLLLYGIYRYLNASGGGEFDTFYYAITFFVYGSLFVSAWAMGFGFARFRFFPWIVSIAVFVIAMTIVVSDFLNLQSQMNADYVVWIANHVFREDNIVHRFAAMLFVLIVPVLFYCVYIVTINELLRKMSSFDPKKFRHLIKRSVLAIAILLLILVLPLIYAYFFKLPDSLYEQLNSAEVSSANFLKKTYNQQTQQPEFDLQDYAQLLPKVELSDETVFCTYIDNFFPLADGGRLPLPVHFRRFVLNRYEPETEKFVLDPYPPSAIPNDLYSPSIKDVPIGFMISDSVIEASTRRYQYRKNIASTVYIQSLAPDAYVAPNTGYTYQKLPVPPEDKDLFTTVYQCSSLISIWNLPPFVYSSNYPELVDFREQRAEALRSDRSFRGVDTAFMAYYTAIDTTDTLIMNLSRELTAGKETPYDKLDAIVDYFTGREADGSRRFTYTLEPGSPKTPGQSFMHYFLFENKRGYCTYFAGATTLLLRAAGIPCRVVVGYAIYDRSNKNTGWYWVYADQGHAWVEVYFPGYGWVDFDTTPSDDTEPTRPPKPDATPPDYAREPFFAVLGDLTGMSGDSTELNIRPQVIRYRSQEFEIPDSASQIITIKPAEGNVTIDGKPVKIGEFATDRKMVISAYSFDYALEKIPAYRNKTPFMTWFQKRFPKVIPVDEAIVVYQEPEDDQGMIFAIDGRIDALLPDSSGISVIPDKIYYRGKDYHIEPKYAEPVKLRPEHAQIYINGKKMPLAELTVGDSMFISAASGHKSLYQIKPFLATESFSSWFKYRFPEVIPVDRIDLKVPKVPFTERFFHWLLIALLAAALLLLLLATLVYLYFSWRAGTSREPQRLYWIYRLSLMMLNQLGFERVIDTPLEYARETVDPQFGTELRQFVNIYHKSKYSPLQLAEEESRFVADFRKQFKEKVFGRYSYWEVLKNFTNFIRTLRFLLAR